MSNFITYKASAGSGKTYTLAVEYIKQLLLSEEAHAHRHILAVTFTKEATGEMKDRIVAELYGLAAGLDESKGFLASIQNALLASNKTMEAAAIQAKAKRALSEILHDYSRFYVGTIDSFFQRVLRNLARELGKGSKFNIELNTVRVIDEAVKAMIEKSNENPDLLEWISRYVEEQINNNKPWKVDRELKSFGQNIFNEYFQEHEMALRNQLEGNKDFIDELIKEHRKLKDSFEKQMSTHANHFFKVLEENNINKKELSGTGDGGAVGSYFKKLLNGQFDDTGSSKMLTEGVKKCLESPEKWVKSDVKKDRKPDIIYAAQSVLIHILQDAESYRTEHLSIYNSSDLLLKNIHQLGLLWDIALEMEAQNKENNRFMLSQTALFLNRMIADSDASFVYEKIGSEIKHVMIDEFQDTSRLQWRNFKSLLSEIMANNNFSLLVGDVKQSIYRWRNGDWSILNGLENELATTTKTLGNNFRSEQRIVHFNNTFFISAGKLLDEKLEAEFGAEVISPFPTAYSEENVKQDCQKSEELGFVSIDILEEDKDGGYSYSEVVMRTILEQCIEMQAAGIAAKDICILTRTNKEIKEIAAFLASEKDEHPELKTAGYLDIISNDAFQLDASPALKIIIEALRLMMDWTNPVPRAQLLMLWKEFDANNARIETNMHALLSGADGVDSMLPEGFRIANFEALALMPLYDLILHVYQLFVAPIISKNPTDKQHALLDQSAYMYAFLDSVTGYLANNPSDIKAFLQYWDEELFKRSVPKKSELAGIQAMTIHKSKGLQFHTVIVPYCDFKMDDSRNGIVWCSKKEAPFHLEILPINHSKNMKRSVFAQEYAEEIKNLWMDNLNVLYVAFTRAESNLRILSKVPSKSGTALSVHGMIDELLKHGLPGNFTDNKLIYGNLKASDKIKEKTKTLNVLKEKSDKDAVEIRFLAADTSKHRLEFRQSNKSKDFIATGENPVENRYIKQGNVMHSLFSKIQTLADTEKAVDELIFEGVLTRLDKEFYMRQVNEAIATAKIESWFSADYRLFNECAILVKDEKGRTRTRRPDRVMLSENEVIVLDYKFGEAKDEHSKQVQQYKQLLAKMGYENISGYLWYVGECLVLK